MEPPFKRQRLSGSSYPDIDLNAQRAQNDSRLKSIFESIFDKYGRNFDGIGDEIDLRTGEIVVNNGHILGMTNERDAGDAKYSSQELEGLDDEDEGSWIQHSERDLAALGLPMAEDVAVMEESDVSGLSDFDADSLMGDVPPESHLKQLGKQSRRAVAIPLDDEEDELASSDIERASYSKDRLGVQKPWYLLKGKSLLTDEPAIEPAWKALPLPNMAHLTREREKIGLASIDNMREYSDDEREGISLWKPEVPKTPRRKHERANPKWQQPLACARDQNNNAAGLLSGLTTSERGARRLVNWTDEEDELLIHLKTTTTLSGADMEPYFPQRYGSAIKSHWQYMIHCGRASPKPQVPNILGHRRSLPSLSPLITPVAPRGTCIEPHDHDAYPRAKTAQTVPSQSTRVLPEAESLVPNLGRPIEQPDDHHILSRCEVDGKHETPNGCIVEESFLLSEAHRAQPVDTMGESNSSAKNCETEKDLTMDETLGEAGGPAAVNGDSFHLNAELHNCFDQSSAYRSLGLMRGTTRIDPSEAFGRGNLDPVRYTEGSCEIVGSTYRANSKDFYDNTDQSYGLSTPLKIEDDVVKSASNSSDQEFEVVAESGCGARASSPTTSTKAEPGSKAAISCKDSFVSSKVGPQNTMTMEESDLLDLLSIGHSELQQEESIPLAAKDMNQNERPVAEGPLKTRPTDLYSINSAQSPIQGKPCASFEPNVEVPSSAFTKRQIVRVVIPLAAASNVNRKSGKPKQSPSSHLHIRSPSATEEIADPSDSLLHNEILVIRTPTRSPSIAAAESQYAASVTFVPNVRSSLGPEIADSQPLSIIPAAATPLRELGTEATRPIIIDDIESQSSCMTPGTANSARQQPRKATGSINSSFDPQPLRVSPEMATPVRKTIEDATESDTVESGSYPLNKRLAAARSSTKKTKKERNSGLAPVWPAIDDYSEDELSYL